MNDFECIVEKEYRRLDFLMHPTGVDGRFYAFPLPPWTKDSHTHLVAVCTNGGDAHRIARDMAAWGEKHPTHKLMLWVPCDGIQNAAIDVLEAHGIRVMVLTSGHAEDVVYVAREAEHA